MEEFGPVQILVVGFDGTSFNGEIMPELQRLKELDIIRLVDMAIVSKDADGEVVGVEVSDLSDEQRAEFGAIAGALIGLGFEPDEEGVEAGAIAGAEAAEDGLLDEIHVVDRRHDPGGNHRGRGVDRAPLGDPAARRDPARRWCAARRQLDPPGGSRRDRSRRCGERGLTSTTATQGRPGQATPAQSPSDIVRDRGYVVVLIMGALLGVPVALVAYFFLKWVADVQEYLFTTLPADLGFTAEPAWWPIPLLVLSGFLVALTIKHLPGTAGHEPAEGFKASGPVRPIDLPGIIIASFATLSLGVVLGPEAPLIAIGSGLGVLAVHLLKRDAPEQAVMVIAAASSFAAISTLLGSPLVGAFLLMEAAGVGGAMLSVVLIPGLLAAGVGSLIFIGLDRVTGFGTFALAIPDIPTFTTPTVAEFVWAIGIGLVAAVVGVGIRRLALMLQPIVARRRVALTPVAGLAIGLAAFVFAEGSDRSPSEVLFSGQSALPSLVQDAAGWTVGHSCC